MSQTTAKKDRLQRSQLNAITGDLDLDTLNLALKGFASEKIIEAVTAAEVERTIQGASTFTVDVSDKDRVLMHSPFLKSKVDTEVDGLWFRLVSVAKESDDITLTFEDREVAIFRTYDEPKSAAWGATTRPKFIRDMVREVKEVKIPFYCPELNTVKLIGAGEDAQQLADVQREPGFGFAVELTVKNRPADAQQREVVERVLRVGLKMKARRKVLVCAIMTATQESTARNLSGGDRDSAGVFQQRPSQGWGTYREVTNIEHTSQEFFSRAITADAAQPWLEYGELCQKIQVSAFPQAYDQWRTEAERTVSAFGVTGGDTSSSSDQATANTMEFTDIFLEGGDGGESFQFTRGQFSQDSSGQQKVKREDTWDCTARLADEVGWRRFMVAGAFYFVSEPYLFKSRPRFVIGHEFDEGIISIDFSYDTGQHDATVKVTALAARWAAPPGTVVMIENMGVINGRWLVVKVNRSLFSPIAILTLMKPRPKLPEPTQEEAVQFSPLPVPTPSTISGFVAPLPTLTDLSVSEFGIRDPDGAPDQFGRKWHAAKDWFAPATTPVVAPIQGTLVEIKQGSGSSGQVFGGVVKLEMDNGMVWVFRHVNPVLVFRVGARVQQGETIATVTRWTDNPGSSHAHIEFWLSLAGGYNYENMVDPIRVLRDEDFPRPREPRSGV